MGLHYKGALFGGIVNVADWYGTLTELAGVDMVDKKSEAANTWLKETGVGWFRAFGFRVLGSG